MDFLAVWGDFSTRCIFEGWITFAIPPLFSKLLHHFVIIEDTISQTQSVQL